MGQPAEHEVEPVGHPGFVPVEDPVEAEEDPGAIDPPINAETPVPGALVLFGTGLAGLGLYRYRRR